MQRFTRGRRLLGLVAGGIALYENRATVLKDMAPLLSRDKPVASRTEAKAEPRRERAEKPAPTSASNGAKAPVPPAAVGMTKAVVPVSRPAVAAAGPLTGENFSGKFYFCGTSGLDNCVMSGDTFWYRKTKVVLADIAAPRTEGAACQQERDRGFAAKVRLKDLLSSGRFDLETAIAYAKMLRQYPLFWYEEIGDPLDYALNAAVSELYPGPIATGDTAKVL